MTRNTFSPFNSVVTEPQNEHATIKQKSKDDRPREKLLAKGAEALTNAELFAILIGGGTTKMTAVELMQKILDDTDNSLVTLQRMSVEELMTYKGIGEAKALTIIAAAELGRRRANESVKSLKRIDTSADAFHYIQARVQDLSREMSWVLLLNNGNSILRCVELSKGGLTETAVDPRVIFHHACLANATGIVLIHNHPSGNVRPSRADDELTGRLNKAAQVIGIRLVDHIVVSDSDYYSYSENGKL